MGDQEPGSATPLPYQAQRCFHANKPFPKPASGQFTLGQPSQEESRPRLTPTRSLPLGPTPNTQVAKKCRVYTRLALSLEGCPQCICLQSSVSLGDSPSLLTQAQSSPRKAAHHHPTSFHPFFSRSWGGPGGLVFFLLLL